MKIQSNIPIPEARSPGRPRIYNFQDMKVGDSVTVDVSYNSMYGSINRFTSDPQYSAWKFRITKLGPRKARFWRVE